MIENSPEEKDIDKAMEYYEEIRKSLNGLSEILKIRLNEKDFFYQAGADNLKALNANILKILKHFYTPRQVRIKLREILFDEEEAKVL
ncbi:MAG: hypothetical protein GF383_11755 [Candidatus Lokiarchaeota archaeon]|nr:hypothetical protein [Candidatus Lokiarchaeota archaeon]MBD3341455.1 hypothetical protein [Candidatus Lokiarchaeota archaeon]